MGPLGGPVAELVPQLLGPGHDLAHPGEGGVGLDDGPRPRWLRGLVPCLHRVQTTCQWAFRARWCATVLRLDDHEAVLGHLAHGVVRALAGVAAVAHAAVGLLV